MVCNKIWILAILTVTSSLTDCVSIDIQSNEKPTKEPTEVCESEICKKIASEMLEGMNRTINPCDNFYEFVCGNYSQSVVIPERKQIQQKIDEDLITIVEKEITDSDPQAFKTFKAFYEVCLDQVVFLEKDRKSEEKELLHMLKEHGGWPVLSGDTWDESKFDWNKLWLMQSKTGHWFDYLIGFNIDFDIKNPSRKMIYIDPPIIDKGYRNYSEEESTNALYKFMVETAVIFGANRARAELDLKQALKFETELSRIVSEAKASSSVTNNNLMTVGEFRSKYPFAYDFVNNTIYPYGQLGEPTEIISIETPNFLSNLMTLINKTPKRVLVDYMFWKIISRHSLYLGERVRRAESKYRRLIGYNFPIEKSKSITCMERARECLGLSAGALYVRKRFDPKIKSEVNLLADNVKGAFRLMFENSKWIEAETKKRAQSKLDEIMIYVAYPDKYFDDKFLDDYHKDIKVYPNSFLKTRRSWDIFQRNHYLRSLRKPFARTDLIADPDNLFIGATETDLYGFYPQNAFFLPAGIFQEYLYNSTYPSYMNYAGIGNYIGHEFGHQFHGYGRSYFNSTTTGYFWDRNSSNELVKRLKCIANQYENYSIKGVDKNINTFLTKEENIADIVGIKVAYDAYDKLRLSKGPEACLPGFEEYSSKQLFWISFANTKCTKLNSKFQRVIHKYLPPAPAEFQVNGPLSNLPEFSKDFNCPVDSKMNPKIKCTLW